VPFHGLRDRVRHEAVVGIVVAIPSPVVVEAVSHAGFHAVLIDAEHSPIAIDTLEHLVRAADVAPIAAVVRVPEVGSYISRTLDLGAAGIVVPRIETVEQAREVVERARYVPEGRRGVGAGRGSSYGADLLEHVARANSEILVAIQIETAAGLDAVDEILAVPGIDAAVIGPYDLATSIGVEVGSDGHKKAIEKVRDAARRQGVAFGTFTLDPAEVGTYAAEGATLFFVGADVLSITEAARTMWSGVDASLSPAGTVEIAR
jgi:2-keto-3-deoxy-L-rhamnonate aldolase RhmA